MKPEQITCPYCGDTAAYMDSDVIYQRSYGMIYICVPCNAYVETHKHAPTKPLGTLADSHLRGLRKRTHSKFDTLWRTAHAPKDARHAAYKLMEDLMMIPTEEAHIAMFNPDRCLMLLHLLEGIEPFE